MFGFFKVLFKEPEYQFEPYTVDITKSPIGPPCRRMKDCFGGMVQINNNQELAYQQYIGEYRKALNIKINN